MPAILIGTISGLCGFILFIMILVNTSDSEQTIGEENVVPVATEEVLRYSFFALQHGVFSTNDAAQIFIDGHANAKDAVVLEINGKHYIWSLVSSEKVDLAETTDLFWKSFDVTNTCERLKEPLAEWKKILQKPFISKVDFSANLPEDWVKIVNNSNASSKFIGTAFAQILSLENKKNDCISINLQ